MASCQTFYYTKPQKGKVWEDFIFVITGQDYPYEHIDQCPQKNTGKYDSIGDKKEKSMLRIK